MPGQYRNTENSRDDYLWTIISKVSLHSEILWWNSWIAFTIGPCHSQPLRGTVTAPQEEATIPWWSWAFPHTGVNPLSYVLWVIHLIPSSGVIPLSHCCFSVLPFPNHSQNLEAESQALSLSPHIRPHPGLCTGRSTVGLHNCFSLSLSFIFLFFYSSIVNIQNYVAAALSLVLSIPNPQRIAHACFFYFTAPIVS